MAPADPAAMPPQLFPKGAFWPLLVVALLVGHIFVVLAAVVFSSTLLPGAAAAPSAYDSGLRWDERQQRRRESELLGWNLAYVVEPSATALGEREVAIVMSDSEGSQLADAEIELTLYHHSRPNEPVRHRYSADSEAEPGVYRALLPLRQEGLWHFEAAVRQGDDNFYADGDFWLSKPAPRAEALRSGGAP